jgi:Glyoxalase-like domain
LRERRGALGLLTVAPSTVYCLTIDCVDADRLASFWCEAIGYERKSETLPAGEIEIHDPAGRGGDLAFVPVPESKSTSTKNRLHLDLIPPSAIGEEVARLEGLGARAGESFEEGGWRWTVMRDPEGNEFCVCARADTRAGAGARP